jgi:hypothetical protein
VLLAVEQAARLLGQEARREPLVARSEGRRPQLLVEPCLLFEPTREGEHPASGEAGPEALRKRQSRPDPVGLVEERERAVHAAFPRKTERSQAERPDALGSRGRRMRSSPCCGATSRLRGLAEERQNLGRPEIRAAPARGRRVRPAGQSFEPLARFGRPPAGDLAFGFDRLEPGRKPRAVHGRGQTGREPEPDLHRSIRKGRDPSFGLAERARHVSVFEEPLDAVRRTLARFPAPRANGRCRRRRFSPGQRRVARRIRDESGPGRRRQQPAHSLAGVAGVRHRLRREPFVETHRGRRRPARSADRAAPLRRRCRQSRLRGDGDRFDAIGEREPHGLESAARNRVPPLGFDRQPERFSAVAVRRERAKAATGFGDSGGRRI